MITNELVERAIDRIKQRSVNYQYFFDHLTSADWLEPLVSKGFFVAAPEPVESEGYISFPLWPESRYLVRIAPLAPKRVMEVALNIKDRGNVRVQEDLIEIAASVPVELGVRLAPRVEQWLQTPYLLLPTKVANLISRLAEAGFTKEALGLTKELLAVIPGRDRVPDGASEPSLSWRPEPQSRIDNWEYEEFFSKQLPNLAKAAPLPTLQVLADLLDQAIRLGKHESDQSYRDYSEIWRPAIEPHAQNSGYGGVREQLASAIRDSAASAITETPDLLTTVVDLLSRYRGDLFQRLALHLVWRFGETNLDLAAAWFSDRELFENSALHHEYGLLVKRYFSRVSPEHRDQFLVRIAAGPDLTQFRGVFERNHGRPPSEVEVEARKEHWQLRRLALIKEALPEPWKQIYRALVDRHRKVEHPDLLSWSSGVQVGPTSPLDKESIDRMSVGEVVEYLRDWRPPEGFMAESPEGLSRTLTEVIADNPGRFADEASAFEGLDPTYVRGLINGLREAAKADKALNWPPILRLCDWVLAQPRDIPGRDETAIDEQDPIWGWARQAIAGLLEEGLSSRTADIPYDLRNAVWQVLRPLTDDPDPSPDHEQRYGGSNMDPATLSINTVRGLAFHALMRYIIWCQRHHDHSAGATSNAEGLAVVPEARETLERHLDPQFDSSLAIRAVYGWWFPALVLNVDQEWSIQHRERIFPMDTEQAQYWQAAWHALVQFNQPRTPLLALMQQEYLSAISRLDKATEVSGWLHSPDERLAAHLLTYYWWGDLPLDSELFTAFWNVAPANLRASAISFVGRALHSTESDVPVAIAERLQQLWEWRASTIRAQKSPEPYVEELRNFGWWFASGKLEEEWSLHQLGLVLDLGHEVEASHLVVSRLAKIAERYPAEAVTILAKMVQGDRKGWSPELWRESARELLQHALASDNDRARQLAEQLINQLGARGYLDYGELLPPKS